MRDDARDAEAEIAAIFTRLREEVRSRPPVHDTARGMGGSRRVALPARAQAERVWAVTAERPFEHPPTRSGRLRGLFVAPVKRVLRKLMRWYVEPVAAHQRAFNLAILNLVDELAERTEGDVARLERRLEALEERVASEGAEAGK